MIPNYFGGTFPFSLKEMLDKNNHVYNTLNFYHLYFYQKSMRQSMDNPAGVKSLWQVLENHLLPPELGGFVGWSSGSCHGLRAKQAFADKP